MSPSLTLLSRQFSFSRYRLPEHHAKVGCIANTPLPGSPLQGENILFGQADRYVDQLRPLKLNICVLPFEFLGISAVKEFGKPFYIVASRKIRFSCQGSTSSHPVSYPALLLQPSVKLFLGNPELAGKYMLPEVLQDLSVQGHANPGP